MAGLTVKNRGIAGVHEFGRSAQGSIFPSGGDDTAAINAATAAGKRLGAGTFLFSGTITALPIASGPGVVLKATSTAAFIRHGPALGSTSLTDPNRRGGFIIDGNSLVSAQPLLTINSVGTKFDPILVQNWGGSGPSIVIGGQNCTFDNLTGDVAFDAGCGGHQFNNPEWFTLVIQETVTPPGQAYPAPEQIHVWGGRIENAPASSYSIHQTAGADVHFHGTLIFNSATSVPLVYVEPDLSAHTNGRLHFHGCLLQGGTSALASSASALGGDFAALFDGHTYFLGQSGGVAIAWTNATQVILNGDYTLGGATTSVYSGSGSAPKAISRTVGTYPETVRIDPALDVTNGIIPQGTWSWTLDTNATGGGYTTNTSNVVNDEIDFADVFAGGTWSIEVLYRKGTAVGQVLVSLDGATLGTIDMYSASPSDNNSQTYTGVVIPVGGKHTLAFKVTGKNASSTGFWALIHQVHARRTA